MWVTVLHTIWVEWSLDDDDRLGSPRRLYLGEVDLVMGLWIVAMNFNRVMIDDCMVITYPFPIPNIHQYSKTFQFHESQEDS